MKQLKLLKNEKKAYGGELLKTRKGRSGPRPLDTKNTMHLVIRSSKARGDWSFRKHAGKIEKIVQKFSKKYGVGIISMANVGNHLHFQIKLANRYTYKPFIRAITGAIAMAVTGASRWKKVTGKFWDHRPFTRVVQSFRGFLKLRDYIRINQIEGYGHGRVEARWILAEWLERRGRPP
jgi:REP element-mobilizing transposase RayT